MEHQVMVLVEHKFLVELVMSKAFVEAVEMLHLLTMLMEALVAAATGEEEKHLVTT